MIALIGIDGETTSAVYTTPHRFKRLDLGQPIKAETLRGGVVGVPASGIATKIVHEYRDLPEPSVLCDSLSELYSPDSKRRHRDIGKAHLDEQRRVVLLANCVCIG